MAGAERRRVRPRSGQRTAGGRRRESEALASPGSFGYAKQWPSAGVACHWVRAHRGPHVAECCATVAACAL
eukprot:2525592-Pyramimonas_sp.AAC.1